MMFSLLQAAPSADLIGQLVTAAQAHEWLVFSALIVGTIVTMTKQGWLGSWLQGAIPAQMRPYFAVSIGMVGTFAAEVITGQPWQKAVMDSFSGALSGIIAVFGHQTVVEHMRGGKEIIPEKQPPAGPPSGGSIKPSEIETILTPPSTPVVIGTKSSPPPPPAAARLSRISSGVYRITWPAMVAICMSLVTMTTGCMAAQQWWAEFQANPAAKIGELMKWVAGVLSSADAAWALLSPLLGASQSTATAAYTDAKVTVVNLLGAIQDAVSAAAALHQDKPDFGALVTQLQAAVAHLVAIVAQYAGGSLGSSISGAQATALEHAKATMESHAAKVAAWGH